MPPEQDPPLPAPLLLYVEDEVLIQAMVVDALEEAGFAAVTAMNGDDALRAIRSDDRIRGMITDINIGAGIDGWEVARLARECSAGLPIVYVSGTNSREWESRGVPNSIMVAKPFAPAQIVVAMSSLLIAVDAAALGALRRL